MSEYTMADSSPDKSVKVTYSARKRRRASLLSYAEGSGDEGDAQVDGSDYNGTPTKEAEDKRTPKKVNVHLPGPAPKRSKPDSSASSARKKPANTAKKPLRSSAPSVGPNVVEQPKEGIAHPALSSKPGFAVGSKALKSKSKLSPRDTPDSVVDDRSEIVDSKAANRIRKTEAERMQFLQDDPHSGEVEPHRVFCMGCKEWVDLNPKRRYIMRLWLAHRKQCGKTGSTEADDASATKDAEAEDEDDGTSIAPSEPAGRKDKQKGSGTTPSSRVATAQRKLQLVNDAQAKTFAPHTVECLLCGITVSLTNSVDYELSEWDKHKETCTRSSMITASPKPTSTPAKIQAPGPPETPTPAEPMEVDEPDSSRPPPSTASTEATVIGSEAPPSRAGEKRQRESEDNDGEDKSKERVVRRRTLLYEAPEGNSPSVMDWMLLPFHTFVSGLRQGMNW